MKMSQLMDNFFLVTMALLKLIKVGYVYIHKHHT